MLKEIIDWLLYSALGLSVKADWVSALHFFIYDSIKILILLFLMIAFVGFLRTYLPENKVKRWISNKKYGLNNLVASFFGAITPFCSCSSIPLFLSFLKAGVPLGVTLSFLITSPLVNEYLVVLMFAFFGWKIALAYVITGMLIGIFSGMVLGRLKLERYLVKDFMDYTYKAKQIKYNLKKRLHFGFNEANSIIRKLWLWILIGVGIGALIHNYVPSAWIQSIVSQGGWFAIPIAVILGVPMYGSCAAIVPVAYVLFEKGIPLGTALAFLMATAALSLPEAVILRRAMKLRLIVIFFAITTLAIIVIGYIYNLLQPMLIA